MGVETHKSNEISVYCGELIQPIVIAKETAKMQVAFPKLDTLFFTVLTERIIKNNFTEKRLNDAVGYLMDNFKYQTPTIADIISFDKKVKIYSHNEVEILINENKARFDDFYKHWIDGILYRVKKTESDFYGLTKYLNQTKE
jgi:hypothetical protein